MAANSIKRCNTCGRTHDLAAWRALEWLGITEAGEWRNCNCGSTLLLPFRKARTR